MLNSHVEKPSNPNSSEISARELNSSQAIFELEGRRVLLRQGDHATNYIRSTTREGTPFLLTKRVSKGGILSCGGVSHFCGLSYIGVLVQLEAQRVGDRFEVLQQRTLSESSPEGAHGRLKIFETLDLRSLSRTTELTLPEWLTERIRIQTAIGFKDSPVIVRLNEVDYPVRRFCNLRQAPYDEVLLQMLPGCGSYELGVERASASKRLSADVVAGPYLLELGTSLAKEQCIFWKFTDTSFKPSAVTIFFSPYDEGLERLGSHLTARLISHHKREYVALQCSIDDLLPFYHEDILKQAKRDSITLECDGVRYSTYVSEHIGTSWAFSAIAEVLQKASTVTVTFPYGQRRSTIYSAFNLQVSIHQAIDADKMRITWRRGDTGLAPVRCEYVREHEGEERVVLVSEEGRNFSPLSPMEVFKLSAEHSSSTHSGMYTLKVSSEGGPKEFVIHSATLGQILGEVLSDALKEVEDFTITKELPPSGAANVASVNFKKTFDGARKRPSTILLECTYGRVHSFSVRDRETGEVIAKGKASKSLPLDETTRRVAVVERVKQTLARHSRGDFSSVLEGLWNESAVPTVYEAYSPQSSRLLLATSPFGAGVPIFPQDEFRLALPRLHSPKAWSEILPLIQAVNESMPSYLFAEMMLHTLAHTPGVRWPDSVLSVGAGIGDISVALKKRAVSLSRQGLAVPRTVDLDYSELVRLSPADEVIVADFEEAALPGQFGLTYCSSIHRFANPGRVLSKLLQATAPGGYIAVKAERYFLSQDVGEWMREHGVVDVVPPNSRFDAPKQISLSPVEASKFSDALRVTNFWIGQRNAVVPITTEPAGSLLQLPIVSRPVARLGILLRALREEVYERKAELAEEIVGLLEGLNLEKLDIKAAGIWKIARRFLDEIVPFKLPDYSLDRPWELHAKLKSDLSQIASSAASPLGRYLSMSIRVVEWALSATDARDRTFH